MNNHDKSHNPRSVFYTSFFLFLFLSILLPCKWYHSPKLGVVDIGFNDQVTLIYSIIPFPSTSFSQDISLYHLGSSFLLSFSTWFSLQFGGMPFGGPRLKLPGTTIFFPPCFQLNQIRADRIFSSIFISIFSIFPIFN